MKHDPKPAPELRRAPLEQRAQIPSAWNELFERLPNASIFMSPQWIQTWLSVYGQPFRGEWLFWYDGDRVVAGALYLARRQRFGPLVLRIATLYTSAEDRDDGPYIEFNDILCDPDYRHAVCVKLAEYIQAQDWDRLYLSGYEDGSLISEIANLLPPEKPTLKVWRAPYVDLTRLKAVQYESLLSSNTRSQLRRSAKLYAERGTVSLTAATTVDEALSYLGALAKLHQASWIQRGACGAFASERFHRFHESLIRAWWPRGNVELLRISAGDTAIGYLYNFAHHGKIYFYQSGLSSESDNRLKPGLTAHAMAVNHHAAGGSREYDFMAGDSRYKDSLATDARNLYWLVIERRTLKMRLADLLAWGRRSARDSVSRLRQILKPR